MKTVKASKKVFKEVAEALMTGLCGHAPEELSEDAKKVYKEMLDCDFKFTPKVTDDL